MCFIDFCIDLFGLKKHFNVDFYDQNTYQNIQACACALGLDIRFVNK